MKKVFALILILCLTLTIIPIGSITASADVGTNTFTEQESNNTMSLADIIYNDYTVSGMVSDNDIDYFEFTLSSRSTVEILTIADYSCFMGGIFNSYDDALAVSIFDEYTDSGKAFYLTEADLDAGTYYYVVLNRDSNSLRNFYTFYFEYTEVNINHTHTYSNACDTTCNTCGAERNVTHTYKTTTTKATLTKNGSIIKKCSVCGTVASTSTIYSPKTFSVSTATYTGKALTPAVTVKDSKGNSLKKGTDYTVSYKNNKSLGTATATVKLKGNYSGSKKLYFTIKPKTTSLSKLTAGKKQLKVTWKKNSSVSGYQLQYSTSKKFKSAKSVTVNGNKTTNKTLKNLKAKKIYYLRIRTYKVVSGKKYYSDWSSVKTKCTSHTHSYSKATCTKAKTCKICGTTSGKPLGHKKDSVICSICGKVTFKTLTYNGTGIKKISNINIPDGDFIMTLVATGTNSEVIDNCFVDLYNSNDKLIAYAYVTVSVPFDGWSSSEQDLFEGPVKNGVIKVEAPNDIKWKITIEAY